MICPNCGRLIEFVPGGAIFTDDPSYVECPFCHAHVLIPLGEDSYLDPPGPGEFCYAVIRKDGRRSFWDVNSIGMKESSAMRKAYMVDELKPEWAKKHPIVRVAKGRFVEVWDETLVRE